jgi:hypothetical protein
MAGFGFFQPNARMTARPTRVLPGACLPALGLLAAAPALAQPTPEPANEMADRLYTVSEFPENPPDGRDERAEDERKNSSDLLIVPIPQSSPSLGTGITLTAAMFYNPNRSPEPWISGVGVMATSNGSKAVGAVHKMSLANDRFRLVAFAGYADVNVGFYGIGPNAGDRNRSIELNEKGLAVVIEGQIAIARHFYIGPRFIYIDLTSSIHREDPLFPDAEIPRAELDTTLSKLGAVISYDARDSSLTPKNGALATAVWMRGVKALGGDFDHDKVTVAGNIYRPITPSVVLAARASYCGVSTGGPFYDLCLYGMSSDLRGYETGRYRDRGFWAVQVELRKDLHGRFGVAAFFGVGESMPKPGGFGDGKFLPAGGLGLRYQPSKDTPVNLRVDYAVGRHSQAIYISLGEAF